MSTYLRRRRSQAQLDRSKHLSSALSAHGSGTKQRSRVSSQLQPSILPSLWGALSRGAVSLDVFGYSSNEHLKIVEISAMNSND